MEGEHEIKLITEILGLESKRGMVTGIYSIDTVLHVFHIGTSAPFPQTVEALFSFYSIQDATFLTVVEKKRTANFVANKLVSVIFEKYGALVEARISPKTLQAFHERNPEETKITFLTM